MSEIFATAAIDEAQGRRRQMLRTAFGPTIAAALADPTVIEVMVNPDGTLWIDRAVVGRLDSGERIGAAEAERIVRMVAAHVRARGHRAHTHRLRRTARDRRALRGRHAARGRGALLCRAQAGRPRLSPERLYRRRVSCRRGRPPCWRSPCATARTSWWSAAPPRGKTTLVNALLAEVADLDERVVILEDTRELKCAAADCLALRTKPGVVSLGDLVRSTLRLRPDRIIVGEVRGPEALDMLKAWNTGHPGGITTVHANSAEAGLYRLEQLVQEAVVTVPRALIVEAIDIVVFLGARRPAPARDAARSRRPRSRRRLRLEAARPPSLDIV